MPELERYFATYYAPDGAWHQGIASFTVRGWLFIGDDGEEPLYAAFQALCLGGRVDLAEAQRKADMALVEAGRHTL